MHQVVELLIFQAEPYFYKNDTKIRKETLFVKGQHRGYISRNSTMLISLLPLDNAKHLKKISFYEGQLSIEEIFTNDRECKNLYFFPLLQ